MYLYLLLLIGSLIVPLIFSFENSMAFYRQWRYVWPAIAVVALFFVAADIVMTLSGVWGFNPRYHLNINLLHLPLEEWLFFVGIPYASLFVHYVVQFYWPQAKVGPTVGHGLIFILLILFALLGVFFYDKAYTIYVSVLMVVALICALFDRSEVINRFFVTFLILLIPFVVVNAILTGTGIDEEVVWYNNQENLNIRLLTIPIEDFAYAFSMILFNLLLIERLKRCSLFNR